MKTAEADIFHLFDARGIDWLVVPTNIGWTKAGQNVMGAGIAKEADSRWGISAPYGAFCRAYGILAPVVPYTAGFDGGGLILFPTKPLADDPSYSWRQESSLDLIARSARQLQVLAPMLGGTIGVPLVGCGNGKLREGAVLPILEQFLSGGQFVLIRR
jgi:hypothetical protein